MVTDFIEALEVKHQKQIIALLEKIAETGMLSNKQKFRKVDRYIYELKTRGGVRILCFMGGLLLRDSIVLTHGFFKPGNKILMREIKKAEKWRKEFINDAEII